MLRCIQTETHTGLRSNHAFKYQLLIFLLAYPGTFPQQGPYLRTGPGWITLAPGSETAELIKHARRLPDVEGTLLLHLTVVGLDLSNAEESLAKIELLKSIPERMNFSAPGWFALRDNSCTTAFDLLFSCTSTLMVLFDFITCTPFPSSEGYRWTLCCWSPLVQIGIRNSFKKTD
ncbi:hypothetical protein CEXT_150201 [Caerostris extrusa]|uniref:Uncharacterized protein n=1 Tax=Caerostris extrusa TaxID=172846 RepID=A0AAV4TBL0_CAEEX|nr:hypothetical protein CEXT_150201 [Caerostris extrusa]